MNKDDGTFVTIFILFLLILWGYQAAGGEEIRPSQFKIAEAACEPNQGLRYMQRELFERDHYVCNNGAEGTLREYLKTQEVRDEHSKAN